MTLTVSTFRTSYPEFSDGARYPDSAIGFYLGIAYGTPGPPGTAITPLLNPLRWKTQLDLAVGLFTAHNVVLERQALDAAENGGTPGASEQGPVSSQSVAQVSVSYDTASAMEKDAGHWNLTVYGLRFKRLMMMFGMGPVQIGIGCAPYPLAASGIGPYGGSGYWW